MQFSFRMPVAVHILLCIACFQKEMKVTSNFLAGSVNVHPVIIRKTLGQLKAAGLVDVAAGVGGAKLKKEPANITLQDIFQAVEEEEDLFHLQENPNPACPVGRNIRALLNGRLQTIRGHMMDDLRQITLQTLLDDLSKRTA